MSAPALLVELLTEELPPRSLARLSAAFADQLHAALAAAGFLEAPERGHEPFATPRRLAVRIPGVRSRQPDRNVTRKGPSVSAGLDKEGKPTQALLGFARSCGADVSALGRVQEGKAEYFIFESAKAGEPLADHLAALVAEALRKLPIPKVMRWGSGEEQFVRPVHGLVMLHGDAVVPGSVLGIAAGRTTRGHRFQGRREIAIATADTYERQLLEEGSIVAAIAARRAEIERQLRTQAAALGAHLPDPEDLLDEVTALVERPAVYVGEFEEVFLAVPQECLILTMRQNQKYFPLLDAGGNLLPKFLIVSNMQLDNPANIVRGNQRVVRPRLADARFFFEQDKKSPLEARLAELGRMVHHNQLGTQRQRVERLRALACHVASLLEVDAMVVDRAALLCKADLATGMVGEFPELQGTMGRYYALHDGESAEVATAMEQHYRPRFAADVLPDRGAPAVLALADRLDVLVGIYGIGLVPTGDKDPFGLRRQALAVLRILLEHDLPLRIYELLSAARAGYGNAAKLSDRVAFDLVHFILDRASGHFREMGYSAEEIEAVLDLFRAHDLPANQMLPRLAALKQFRALPEAASLIEANKRSRNILVKEKAADQSRPVRPESLVEPAEQALHAALLEVAPVVAAHVERSQFAEALRELARLRGHVDRFFTEVRVVVPEDDVRTNRYALLHQLNDLLNRVANISRLPA